MEYHVDVIPGVAPDVERVALALQDFDPAAFVDFQATRDQLRIHTDLSGRVLLGLLAGVGIAATPQQLHPQPTVCCGGCGG